MTLNSRRNIWLALGVSILQMGRLSATVTADQNRAVPLIFDTDIGNDVDDVLALGVIHSLMSRGECELIAVTVTKDEEQSAPFVDAINTFYGRGDIPIGVVINGPTPEPSKFTSLANAKDGDKLRYPHALKSRADARDASLVLRKALADANDSSVVVVQVGFSTNLARFLATPGDEFSPLNGLELAQKKVRLLSVMAGSFVPTKGRQTPEYNVLKDVSSARKLFSNWPTPIVFSGFEIGIAVTFPAESIERDFAYVPHHPLAEAYTLYNPPPHNRPSWDLTSVLYAVRPEDGYFELSEPGRVQVADDGSTSFVAEPTGLHRYLVLAPERIPRVREALRALASEPPSAACRR